MEFNFLTKGIKRKPYQHQLDAVGFFQNRADGNLFFEMGCVSGDTEIYINRGGSSKKMKISEAFIKVPKMRTFLGETPEIRTRSFKGDRIGLHKIKEIKYSGIKVTLEIHLADKKTLKLTPDHEVLTDNGFVRAENLRIDDRVMVDSTPKATKSGLGRMKINYLYTRVKEHPYGRSKSVIRKVPHKPQYIESYCIVPTHRLIAEKELNNGIYLDPEMFAVHHRDRNPRNNDKNNLLICTHEEHRAIHAKENSKNLGQGTVSYSTITDIHFCKKEDTYDIICEDPHRNFVANGIVVHNCGKTGTAILIYREWCRQKERLLRCLVLAPSVVLHNWKDEFGLFSKIDQTKILPLTKGSGKDKALLVNKYTRLNPDGMIINVNYEALLTKELFEAIEAWNPEVIIFDEVQYIKNCQAKRSKLCIRLAELALHRLGLTGTPILKNSTDIFGIFRAVDLGQTFGTNQYVFQNKYLIDKNARIPQLNFPNWVDNVQTYEELNQRIYRKSLRKLKSECLDLPDLIKVNRYAEWGTKQKKAYDELKKEFLTFVDNRQASGEPESVTASLAVVKAIRLLQVCSGFVQTDDGTIHEFDDVPRLTLVEDLLQEIVVEGGNKCILWCSYKFNYKQLAKICEKLKLKYCFITGEQNTTEKRESELAFQNDPSMPVIICNRGAGGVGVNLTAAPYSIIYSRNFSLAEELQSEARNHRGGSEVHDKIIKIDISIKGSVEEAQIEALRNKHQVSSDILDMVRGG